MLVIFVRAVIIFLIVLVFIRLMGKRQIGEMQPFELVITIIIADLATTPMAQNSIPLLHGLIPALTLVVLHFGLSLISRKSIIMRRVISGKPVIVISGDGIDYAALKSLNMNFDDLSEGLRTCGYINIEDIQYAVVETNGTFTAIPKAEKAPVVNEDMDIKLEEVSLPVNLITSGKIMNANMKLMQVSMDDIKHQLAKMGNFVLKDVMLLSLDNNGKIFMQPFRGKYQVLNTNLKGGSA